MKILAFDTSTDTLTVGLYEDGKVLAEESSSGFARHSDVLLPTLEKIFGTASLKPVDLDLIAVGLGPGSFTGLRVGLVAAKMLGFVTGKKIVGIPSFEILAASQEIDGPLAVFTDAKRNKVYAWSPRGPKTELTDLKRFLPKIPRDAAVLAGIPLDPSTRAFLEKKGCRILSEPKPVSAFYAARIALSFAQKKRFTAPEDLKPLYLYPKDCNVTQKKK